MTELELNDIYMGIYTGSYNLYKLPVSLFRETFYALWSDVETGYELKFDRAVFGTDNYNLLTQFRKNINVFSGAKTFQQIKDSQNFILDATGKMRAWNDYLADVKSINALYNETWLKVERDITIKQAQSARLWQDIQGQKDILPYLQYITVRDERVRIEHRAMDGIIRRVDDKFWDLYYPPNDWGCRCEVRQIESGKETKLEGERMNLINEGTPKLFRMNAAKDGYIFKTEGLGSHPYMLVGDAFEVVKGVNFFLPEL
jgi:SPP1 gp7 family putative phage head morphogenesis protein